MKKLSHFNNSKASTGAYEVIRKNLYEVIFTPPVSVQGKEMLLEHVISVTGLDIDKTPGVIVQQYQSSQRRYGASAPETTTVDIVVKFTVNLNEQNQMYVYNTLRSWRDLVYDPLTGATGLKKDYVGNMIINIFDPVGNVFRKVDCKFVFPMTNLPAMDLDSTQLTEVYEMEVTFACDVWDDVTNK